MTIRNGWKRLARTALALAALVAVGGSALAQEATKKFGGTAVPAIAGEQTDPSGFAAGTGPAEVPTDRLALVFLLICGLLYLTYFGLKKYVAWSRSSVNKKRSVGVIDTISLGGKRFVTVTRVYDRILVLGVGEDTITLLTELKDGEEAGTAPAAAVPATPTPRGVKPTEHFANLLASLTKKRQAAKAAPAAAEAETAIL